jgi:4-hydroxybenzoate polyprenyltransferase
VGAEGALQRSPAQRIVEAARLVHPFPSLLDGVVVGVVAAIAGAELPRSLLLASSMALLQFAIGSLNDLVDAPRDAATKHGKPIPDGVVGESAARVVMVLSGVAGVAAALAISPFTLVLALAVLAIGAWYDLVANGSRLSWLPLALGVPILPIYGWLGATGGLPPEFTVLAPASVLAGAAIAIANASVDIERDAAAAKMSLAVALGPVRATALVLALQVLVAATAVASASRLGASGTWLDIATGVALVPVAGALLGLAASRRGPAAREVAFELQAVGLGLLVVAWVNAVGAVA